MLYPLVLSPVFKDYLWGGTNLKNIYHKNCAFPKVAESWELASHSEGTSPVSYTHLDVYKRQCWYKGRRIQCLRVIAQLIFPIGLDNMNKVDPYKRKLLRLAEI